VARQQAIALIIRLVIGGFFVVAAWFKIADPMAFAFQIDHYQLLPWVVTAALALYLPWLELVCGIAVITGYWLRGAAGLILVMLTVFVIALVSASMRGLDISCGCLGGEGGNGGISLAILRDLAMIGGILLVLRRKR